MTVRSRITDSISNYPTKPEHANLAAIETLRIRYDLPIGWSDHTVTPAVVERAIGRFNASVIEFHLDLDRDGAEYGSGHCWLPEAIGAVIQNVNTASTSDEPSASDGDGCIGPCPTEEHERLWRSDPSDGLRPCLEERARLENL